MELTLAPQLPEPPFLVLTLTRGEAERLLKVCAFSEGYRLLNAPAVYVPAPGDGTLRSRLEAALRGDTVGMRNG